jgi:hypothetical protein
MSGWLVLLALGIGGVLGFHIANAISLRAPGWAALGALLGAIAGASSLGRVGHRARNRARIPGIGLADGILGAVLGAGVALLVLWFTTPIFTGVQQSLTAGRSVGGQPGIFTRIEQALGIPGTGPPSAGPAPGAARR